MTRDSDTHPTGGDALAAPFMGSAGAQRIAQAFVLTALFLGSATLFSMITRIIWSAFQ